MAKKLSTSTLLFTLVPLMLVAIIGLAVWQGNKPSPYADVAACLTEKGAQMYGAWWCPHCENQKQAFGSAFKNINYVECSPNNTRTMSAECQEAGIKSYPTWRFEDGSELTGEQSPEVLAARAGCELPQE